jgi:hypothetical protein
MTDLPVTDPPAATDSLPAGDPLPVIEMTGPESAKMARLLSIGQDLADAHQSCVLLIDELAKPEHFDNGIIGGRDDNYAQALYTQAVISYSRAFASGRRSGLNESDLAGIAPEALAAHRYFRRVRDQHIAHSVLPFEDVRVGVALNSLNEAEAKILGVSWMAIRRTSDERDGIRNLMTLIEILIAKINSQLAEQEKLVIVEAEQIGAGELRKRAPMMITVQTVDIDNGPPRD